MSELDANQHMKDEMIEELMDEFESSYIEELLDYIREETEGDAEIVALTDQDLEYVLIVWSEYLEALSNSNEDEEEFLQIDPDDLYAYLCDAIEEDEMTFKLSQESMITIIELEEAFVESFRDEDEDEEEGE